MRFYGNQTCCGSYACLNAIQAPAIDPSMFEISTGAPFGVRHCENAAFDRLLTTFHDPNQGLDDALRLWGYRVSTFHAERLDDLLSTLCTPGQGTVVLGPINMSGLGYQAVPSLFNRMDHYIALEYQNDTEILCTDSEGLSYYRVSLNQLTGWININGLPEACGQITLRVIEREHAWDWSSILVESMRRASSNLCAAEQGGQGSHAFSLCLRYLEQHDRFLWKLPFLYDIEYLHQRKRLFQLLLITSQKTDLLSAAQVNPLQQTLMKQEALLSEIYRALQWDNHLPRNALLQTGELEADLVKQLCSIECP